MRREKILMQTIGELSEIPIRSIQHFLYCPHRWGLMTIDQSWAENVFVTKANLIHKRSHNEKASYKSRCKHVYTSVSVYYDETPYRLYGVCDCIEAKKDKNGIDLPGLDGKYRLTIVEYKPTAPKNEPYHKDDLMQVFAQKICADHVFGTDVDGVIYYANIKKRITLPLNENYNQYHSNLIETLNKMRDYQERGFIPQIRKGQKCSGCSLKDICMPKMNKETSVFQEIKKLEGLRS